jgi:glycosyltransferase involved in cell wall biosynthesis
MSVAPFLSEPRPGLGVRSAGDASLRPLPKLAVVIPALNEAETIGSVIAAVPRRLDGVGAVDVILVDDGSRDETRQRAIAAGVDVIATHPQRRGLVSSFKEGVREALRRGASIVVNLDADGQHDPAFIPRLIEPIVAGEADIVLGVRPLAHAAGEMSPVRRQGNRVGSWIARRTLGIEISDVTSGYRAFSREALMRLNVISDYTYTVETLIQAVGKRLTVAEVTVPVRPRLVGESRMTRSVTSYIRKTGGQALRSVLRQHLVALFMRMAFATGFTAFLCTTLFLLGYHADGAGRHLPALLAALLFSVLSVGFFVSSLIADGINSSRRLLEDALYHLKCLELGEPTSPRDVH